MTLKGHTMAIDEKALSTKLKKVSLKELVEAGVHFGHNKARWNPKMRSFIWGTRNKTHLIDVAKTSFLLSRACTFLAQAASSGKSILWIGTKKAAQKLIQEQAGANNNPYVIHRWIGGTLSNYEQVKKAVTRLLHLRDVSSKSIGKYTKKEQSMIQKEIDRLEKNVGGIIDLSYPPAAIIVVDAKKERSAIREAGIMGIPVIGLVDTNSDPEGISYVIPSNDDSPRAISLILQSLSDAVSVGSAEAEKEKAKKAAAIKAEKELKAKEAADRQAAAKADKPAAKEVEVKKAPAKKAAPKKAAPKAEEKVEAKAEEKPAEKKAPAKKAAPKAAAAKKPAAKKTTAKKTTAKAEEKAEK